MSYDEYEARRTITLPLVIAGAAVVAAIGISLFAVASVREATATNSASGRAQTPSTRCEHTWSAPMAPLTLPRPPSRRYRAG